SASWGIASPTKRARTLSWVALDLWIFANPPGSIVCRSRIFTGGLGLSVSSLLFSGIVQSSLLSSVSRCRLRTTGTIFLTAVSLLAGTGWVVTRCEVTVPDNSVSAGAVLHLGETRVDFPVFFLLPVKA